MSAPQHPASPSSPAGEHAVAGLSRSLWWMVFIGDTVTLSMVLGAFKDFTLTPTLATAGWLALYTLALVLLTGALVYDGYAKEKAQGKVKNTFGLFDRLYALQMAQTSPEQNNKKAPLPPSASIEPSLPTHTDGTL